MHVEVLLVTEHVLGVRKALSSGSLGLRDPPASVWTPASCRRAGDHMSCSADGMGIPSCTGTWSSGTMWG